MVSPPDRLRGLFRLGWIVQTHFANFDLVPDLDWERAVIAAVPEVEAAESVVAYYRALQHLVSRLRDGHTFVVEPESLRAERGRPPVDVAWLQEQPVVTWVAPSLTETGLTPGMVLLAVDNRPATEVVAETAAELSASTEHGRYATACQRMLDGPLDRPAAVLADDGAATRLLSLPRSLGLVGSGPLLPIVETASLPHNLAYIAIDRLTTEDVVSAFDRALAAALAASGLVLDLRRNGGGNSSYARPIAARLTDTPLRFERSRTHQTLSSFVAWGWSAMMMEIDPVIEPPRERPFLGPIAVLVGPLTASAAEDFLVGLSGTGRATLVGQPTCGSTGQPLKVDLPGGGWAKVCTRRCLYPDGREFVGRGIPPDLAASPTIAGLRAGRDEVLEIAVSWLAANGAPGRAG